MLRRKKVYDYFDCFIRLSAYSVDAAHYLHEVLSALPDRDLEAARTHMHEIEHAADEAKNEMMQKLLREFLPPIERDDIISLSHCIDDVTDAIEDVLIRYSVFEKTEVRQESIDFSLLIRDCVEAMHAAVREMQHYEKSKTLFGLMETVRDLKSQGAATYVSNLRTLYQEDSTPENVLVYSEIFMHMKRCCDRCKLVINDMERIVMKNI